MKFKEKVLKEVRRIPRGKVSTYSEIARKCGSPLASRAVGNILNRNDDPMCDGGSIPCHRVICSDGSIGGFAKGTREKIRLLKSEGIRIKNGRLLTE